MTATRMWPTCTRGRICCWRTTVGSIEAQGKVRIPIERAMELIAQRGLPVAKAVEQAPLMTGDKKPVIAVPLTNGFARTGYEMDQAAAIWQVESAERAV